MNASRTSISDEVASGLLNHRCTASASSGRKGRMRTSTSDPRSTVTGERLAGGTYDRSLGGGYIRQADDGAVSGSSSAPSRAACVTAPGRRRRPRAAAGLPRGCQGDPREGPRLANRRLPRDAEAQGPRVGRAKLKCRFGRKASRCSGRWRLAQRDDFKAHGRAPRRGQETVLRIKRGTKLYSGARARSRSGHRAPQPRELLTFQRVAAAPRRSRFRRRRRRRRRLPARPATASRRRAGWRSRDSPRG